MTIVHRVKKMIKNIWNTIEVYCNHRHEKPVKMEIQEGTHSLFYACPKYHAENRLDNEPTCPNRINLIDYEAMIDHISEILESSELNGEVTNLTNYCWVSKAIEFKVFEHTDKIKLIMLNKKAVK